MALAFVRYCDHMATVGDAGGYCRVVDLVVPVRDGEPCETCGALHGHYPGYVWNGNSYDVVVRVNPINPDYNYGHKPENHTDDGL